MRVPPRRSVSREDRLTNDVTSGGSASPDAEVGGIVNPGYSDDTDHHGNGNVAAVPSVVESHPVDDITDRKLLLDPEFRYKLFKTIFMILGPCSMGIYLELAGPTLISLKSRIGADYEEISRVLVARSVGYLLGSLVGGVLSDLFQGHLELMLSSAYYFGAFGTGLITWCPNLWSMGLMFHLQGIGEGIIDTCNNVLCVRMWGRQAAAPIHAVHFGFGVGAIIAPQLARPFVTSTDGDPGVTSNVTIPYSISSILTFVFCLAFAAFYFYERTGNRAHRMNGQGQEDEQLKDKPRSHILKELFSPASCTNGRLLFGTFFFILFFVLYMNIVGGERAVSKFLYSYAVERPLTPLTPAEAASLTTVFWLCFSGGRAVTVLASQFVSPGRLIAVELLGNMAAATLLLLATLWARESQTAVWAGVSLLGVSLSPVFPTALSWANLHLDLRGVAVAWAFAGSACGGALYQWVTGYLFEHHGPYTLVYVLFFYAVLLTAVFVALTSLVRCMGGGDDDVSGDEESDRLEKTSSETQTDDVTDAEVFEDAASQKNEIGKSDTGTQAWPWEINNKITK